MHFLAVKLDVFLRNDEWRRFQKKLSGNARRSRNGREAGILVAALCSFSEFVTNKV